jgi:hypothetical protein
MNQRVRIDAVTADTVCEQVQDTIKSLRARTTLTLEDVVSELTAHYRSHLYVHGTFSADAVLGGTTGVCFIGSVCGEKRTIIVY